MSLSNAFRFFRVFREDAAFRQRCYTCPTRSELLAMLEQESMDFSDDEFSDAVTSALFKCQTEDEALNVRQIEQMFRLFR
ncbi:MAG: hypothetical protein LBR34_02925 [Prevotella sp.]|jgi:hypothetical protein|nr:hypothetical protein [Prevotella sp.]